MILGSASRQHPVETGETGSALALCATHNGNLVLVQELFLKSRMRCQFYSSTRKTSSE